MKYFLLKGDKAYADAPILADWSGKIDPRLIRPGESHKLPDRLILNILPNPYVTFVDVLTSPFLLLSKTCMDVVKLYQRHTVSKQLVLLDAENRQKSVYHLPILKQLSCLTDESVWNKSVLLSGTIDLDKVGDEAIFQMVFPDVRYTVIRLDMLESMLKRGARGLKIEPLNTTKGG